MIYYVVIVLVVISLSEIIKRTEILHAKLIPILNIALGICIHIAYSGFDISKNLATGFLVGILSTGVYSSVKNAMEWIKL